LGDPVVAPRWLSNLKDDAAEKRNWLEDNPQVAAELERKLQQWTKAVPPL
jgi:hypothetical protein